MHNYPQKNIIKRIIKEIELKEKKREKKILFVIFCMNIKGKCSKEEQKQFIAELLKKKEKQPSLETGKLMPLQEYIDLGVNELTHSKPKQLFINGAEHINFGDSWTSFMIHCVRYFIDQGDIKDDFTPVCSSKGKRILIPNLSMSDNKDHKFDKVIPFCFVDTKYNVSYQLKNLVKIMQHFGIEQNYKIELSIYRHK